MRGWFSLVALTLTGTVAAEPPSLEAWSINVEPWGFERTGDGISSRFMRYLSQSAGVPLEISVRPYLRAEQGLRDGQNAMSVMIPTPERERIAILLCQPASLRISVLYRRNIVGHITQASGLAYRNIGALRGSQSMMEFAGAFHFRPVLINTQEQGMRMMRAGRLDGTTCAHPGCMAARRAAGLEAGDFGEVLLGARPAAVLVSRASPLAADGAALARLRTACESKEGQRLMTELLRLWE